MLLFRDLTPDIPALPESPVLSFVEAPHSERESLAVQPRQLMNSVIQYGTAVPASVPTVRLAVVCGAAALLFLILLCLDLRRDHENTFSVFYCAAKTMATGGDIYKSHPPGSDRCEYVYPPLFAALVTPLTCFRVRTATQIWTLIDAVLTLGALMLASVEAVRRFQIPATKANISLIAAGSLLLGIGEIKTELGTSQTDTLVLTSFILALIWMDRLPILCGVALGFGCNIKYQTLIALPYLLLTRRWKAAASTFISSAAFASLPALLSVSDGTRNICKVLWVVLDNLRASIPSTPHARCLSHGSAVFQSQARSAGCWILSISVPDMHFSSCPWWRWSSLLWRGSYTSSTVSRCFRMAWRYRRGSTHSKGWWRWNGAA